MAKSKTTKTSELTKLTERLDKMKSVVFAGYTGLKVKEVTDLRNQLRAEGVEIIVAKKTLLRRALTEVKMDAAIADSLTGEVALAFGMEDEILPARLIRAFSRKHDALVFKGAVVNGQFLDAGQTVELAKLPGKDELRAKLVWVLNSPMTGMVNVLAGPVRGLINVLSARRENITSVPSA